LALENVPASIAADGNFRITAVPSGANALSVAILTGGTAVPLTYGFTPSGFNRNITENSVDDPRLTLKQVLSRPGTSTEVYEVQYVDSVDTKSAKVNLVEGTAWSLNMRYGVDNATVLTVGQKADVASIVCGKQRRDAPTANGLQTISQTLYVTAPTVTDAVLVA